MHSFFTDKFRYLHVAPGTCTNGNRDDWSSHERDYIKRAIAPVLDKYDFILLDCPPQLGLLTINALACSDYVVIPVKTDYLAYRGVELLMESIAEVKALINPQLSVMGVVATMFEKRVKDDNEILQALSQKHNVIGVVKKMAIAKKVFIQDYQ